MSSPLSTAQDSVVQALRALTPDPGLVWAMLEQDSPRIGPGFEVQPPTMQLTGLGLNCRYIATVDVVVLPATDGSLDLYTLTETALTALADWGPVAAPTADPLDDDATRITYTVTATLEF